MKSIIQKLSLLSLGLSFLVISSCKKDVNNVPLPGGKASVSLVSTANAIPGESYKLDYTFISVSAMKKFSVDYQIVKKDGTTLPITPILTDSVLDGSLKYEFNYYFNIPENLMTGDVIKLNTHVVNADATADFGKSINVIDATSGFIFYPTTLSIKAGTAATLTMSAYSSVHLDELIIKDLSTGTIMLDSALIPSQKSITINKSIQIPAGTPAGTKNLEFRTKDKKNGRDFSTTYNISIN